MASTIWKSVLYALALPACLTACSNSGLAYQNKPSTQTSYYSKLGVDLDGIGDGMRSKAFVDIAKTLRPWTKPDGKPATTDANGWPTSDAQTCLFDIRPFPAWNPPIDDPDKYQPDWGGIYHISFHGQAQLSFIEQQNGAITNLKYDAAKNLTTCELNFPKSGGLLVMSFAHTRRTASSPEGTGITELKVIRPGYPANTTETFNKEFLASLKPFSILRYMDWLDTNHQPGYYGDAGHHAANWSGRRLPTDATQQATGDKYGVAWEYVVQLANTTNKDLWINTPIAATDDYVKQLATMLKRDLKPNLKIYIEHSNEVWNFGFPQYTYNKLAAIEEVKNGETKVALDGAKDQEVWTHRRHGERLVKIGNIFRHVFGETGSNGRIRPVYASWVISPKDHYADVLSWVEKTYGPPKNLFYGVAGAAYFNAEKAPVTASPEQIVAAMRANSDENLKWRTEIGQIAAKYGLKHCQYEVGPDTGGGKTENVANRIRANRLPAMKDVILHDALDNWFAKGGDLYMYFSHCSSYSRYGGWGLAEDIVNLNTPKYQAINILSGK